MPSIILKNKPLLEAILEVRWGQSQQSSPEDEKLDPNYRLLLGRFSMQVEEDYPYHEALPTAQIPDDMVVNLAQHRFRVGAQSWPLLQMGPGLMTVNETQGYDWDDFRARCEKAVESLVQSHPQRNELAIQSLSLRYINAINVDFRKENVFEYLAGKLQTRISLPDSLFSGTTVDSNPNSFNWQVSYPTTGPNEAITMRYAMGKRDEKPALIWELQVKRHYVAKTLDLKSFPGWLATAHDLIDSWFLKLTEGDLRRSFSE